MVSEARHVDDEIDPRERSFGQTTNTSSDGPGLPRLRRSGEDDFEKHSARPLGLRCDPRRTTLSSASWLD